MGGPARRTCKGESGPRRHRPDPGPAAPSPHGGLNHEGRGTPSLPRRRDRSMARRARAGAWGTTSRLGPWPAASASAPGAIPGPAVLCDNQADRTKHDQLIQSIGHVA
jgi:hypothetical protein